ncbi:hypothetical protein EVAR_81617_1 [Eumeta japonica]|uniref:Uncharacterized protein n=1 Tax=Eumeta variegata TaxID=151549 RepID=A0A4C1WFZ6_EUMVA|nr:hypothetical protein EVAR_81617_1 [Eumeta japonica]
MYTLFVVVVGFEKLQRTLSETSVAAVASDIGLFVSAPPNHASPCCTRLCVALQTARTIRRRGLVSQTAAMKPEQSPIKIVYGEIKFIASVRATVAKSTIRDSLHLITLKRRDSILRRPRGNRNESARPAVHSRRKTRSLQVYLAAPELLRFSRFLKLRCK